jgi:calcium/calmodulin-dependent protein kinase I
MAFPAVPGQYTIVRQIADQHTTAVYLARNNADAGAVAIKYPKPKCVQLWRELEYLHAIRHPHIVTLIDSFETPYGPAIVLPFASGGSLYDRIVTFGMSEDEVRHVMFRVLKALAYLHEHDLWHRDVKPENILFMNAAWSSVVLCDFGYCGRFKAGVCNNEYCGSEHYASPEFTRHEAYMGSVDVWALGITMFCCLTSRMPFDGDDQEAMRRDITNGLPNLLDFPELDSVSAECQHLLDWMLRPEPQERPGPSEALRHTWFRPLWGQT